MCPPLTCATSVQNQIKVKSIWIQDHSGFSNAAALDAPKYLLWGEEYLQEEMLNTKFRISPTSFFQVNTPAASLLYDLVRQWCGELDEDTTLFDVCCGTGTIGLCIAKNSQALKEIVGLEIVEDAVLDAIANAKLNGITNARFLVGKAEDTILKVVSEYPELKKKWQPAGRVVAADSQDGAAAPSEEAAAAADAASAAPAQEEAPKRTHKFVAVLDPPRGGVHPRVLRALRECEAITRIIYVSCNPVSLIADASVLTRTTSNSAKGPCFVPVQARALDLFPHTPHTELVMMFQRGTPAVDAIIAANVHAAANPPPHFDRRKRAHDEVTPADDDLLPPSEAPEHPETTSVEHPESSSAEHPESDKMEGQQ
jgi:tRNA (uracil-5-)-methyltransferase